MPLTIYNEQKAQQEQKAIYEGEKRLDRIEQEVAKKKEEYRAMVKELDILQDQLVQLKMELKQAKIPLTDKEEVTPF